MAIVGQMDLGIGDYSSQAYVRIHRFTYNPTANRINPDGTLSQVPEVEIEIHNYHNKACRQFEIIKNYCIDYIKNNEVTDEHKLWLQDNILCRVARPLQTLTWATIDLSRVADMPVPPDQATSAIAIPYFYNWIKTYNVMGRIVNMQDDLDMADTAISSFKFQHKDIFGG